MRLPLLLMAIPNNSAIRYLSHISSLNMKVKVDKIKRLDKLNQPILYTPKSDNQQKYMTAHLEHKLVLNPYIILEKHLIKI